MVARAKRSLMERLLERLLERWMEQSLLMRSPVWSLMVRLLEWLLERSLERLLPERLLEQSPLNQVLQQGADTSKAIGLMSCLLMWQSDPKRSQRPRRLVTS